MRKKDGRNRFWRVTVLSNPFDYIQKHPERTKRVLGISYQQWRNCSITTGGDGVWKAIGLPKILSICFNSTMTLEKFPIEIPESERTPLVNWLLNLVAEQRAVNRKAACRQLPNSKIWLTVLMRNSKRPKNWRANPKLVRALSTLRKKTQKKVRNDQDQTSVLWIRTFCSSRACPRLGWKSLTWHQPLPGRQIQKSLLIRIR